MQEKSKQNNTTILITGAAGDLGSELVKKAISLKWKVVALTTSVERLREKLTKTELKAVEVYQIDFSSVQSCENFRFLKKYTFNYILLNAGVLIKKEFEAFSPSDIEKQFSVNLFANIYLLQALLPHNICLSDNHILAIGSMSGVENSTKFPQMTMYGASKAALHNTMQTLAAEYAETGIIFNTIAFGAVKTKMLKQAFGEIQQAIQVKQAADFVINFISTAKKVSNGNILYITKSTI